MRWLYTILGDIRISTQKPLPKDQVPARNSGQLTPVTRDQSQLYTELIPSYAASSEPSYVLTGSEDLSVEAAAEAKGFGFTSLRHSEEPALAPLPVPQLSFIKSQPIPRFNLLPEVATVEPPANIGSSDPVRPVSSPLVSGTFTEKIPEPTETRAVTPPAGNRPNPVKVKLTVESNPSKSKTLPARSISSVLSEWNVPATSFFVKDSGLSAWCECRKEEVNQGGTFLIVDADKAVEVSM